MHIFNRREVFITRQLQKLCNATEKLALSGVPYTTKASTFVNANRGRGIPFMNAGYANEYRVYVHKADYERAKKALGQVQSGAADYTSGSAP